jgi:DNA invertase Pin-like site-specific DNA recombinase
MQHQLYPRPIVAYLRVSTGKQDLESQWMTIEAWAKSRDINIDERIVEEEPISGREDQRPRFQELWRRVREKRVGTVVVAELSRLSRKMRTLVNFLYDCFENNVMVVSIREGWLEDAIKNDVVRPIIIAVFATLYELERKMISERTKAGMARAKAQGKHVGRRPKLPNREVKEMLRLYREGVPIKRIAERFNVSRSTVYRYLEKYGEHPP